VLIPVPELHEKKSCVRTSPFQALRSVWQTDVKSTLTRTSRRPGGATSTSSIASGSPGPHATAAARARQPCSASHDLPPPPAQKSKNKGRAEIEEGEAAAGNSTFAFDGLPSCARTVLHRAALAVGRRR